MAVVDAPVIGDGGARNLKEPFLRAERAAFGLHTIDRFEKNLRSQVFGLFPITHFAIHIAVDRTQIFLIEGLEILGFFLHLLSLYAILLARLPAQNAHTVLPVSIVYVKLG